MKSFTIILITLCFSNFLLAQQPRWIMKTPGAENTTFYYQVAKGYGSTIDAAKEKMYLDVKSNIAEKQGLPSNVKISSNSQMSSGGEISLNVENSVDGSIQMSIPMRRVCDHISRLKDGSYVSYGLYQVGQGGNIKVSFVDFAHCYKMNSNLNSLWRSAIIPGWGQMYKGQHVKGIAFLGSEAALIGTALYFQNSYQDNITKSKETTRIDIQKAFRDKANTDASVRNVALIGAAVVYIWNLVDAVSNNSGARNSGISSNLLINTDSYSYCPSIGYKIPF